MTSISETTLPLKIRFPSHESRHAARAILAEAERLPNLCCRLQFHGSESVGIAEALAAAGLLRRDGPATWCRNVSRDAIRKAIAELSDEPGPFSVAVVVVAIVGVPQ